jgi:hypothetical protein
MFMRNVEPVHGLFVLNICLQIFDGVATYQGMQTGMGEGNPLIATAMAHLGIGSALLLFKAKACGCLLLLRRMGGRPLVTGALAGVAATYGALSFVPWLVQLCTLV